MKPGEAAGLIATAAILLMILLLGIAIGLLIGGW